MIPACFRPSGPENGEIKSAHVSLDTWRDSKRSRLSRMPHGRHMKDERKEMKLENFSLDGSSHRTGNAAFTPASPQDLQHWRASTDSHNTQYTRVKRKYIALYAKTHSAQPEMFWMTHHTKPEPKLMRVMLLFLLRV